MLFFADFFINVQLKMSSRLYVSVKSGSFSNNKSYKNINVLNKVLHNPNIPINNLVFVLAWVSVYNIPEIYWGLDKKTPTRIQNGSVLHECVLFKFDYLMLA